MIYHISDKNEWVACDGQTNYFPQRYVKDGFVHCSDKDQVEDVANSMFKGRADLMLLTIDPTKLISKTVYENLSGGDEKFPHVYGAIDKQAIVEISEFKCDNYGLFHMTK